MILHLQLLVMVGKVVTLWVAEVLIGREDADVHIAVAEAAGVEPDTSC